MRRVARQVGRDRAQVGQVHRHRVVGPLADVERGGRRRRRDEDVHLAERRVEVPDDQRPHLLRLAVVGVVVAAGQGVGAEHDPALDLGAEARPPGMAAMTSSARAAAGPQPVPHAVEPGQVGRDLARRDQVVRGQRVLEVRAADLGDLRAERLKQLDRLGEPGHHARLVAVAGELADDADPQPGHVAVPRRLDHRRHRGVDRRGVHRVVPGHDLVQQGGVEYGPAERPRACPGTTRTRRPRTGSCRRRSAWCRRSRTPRRAGGSSRRCRCRARAAPRRRRPRRPSRPRSRRAPSPGSTGCGVGPKPEFSVEEPIANSSMLVLPMRIAPASRSRRVTVDSYGGYQPSRIFEPQVVGIPTVANRSLTATGTPASAPSGSPAARLRSTSRACAQGVVRGHVQERPAPCSSTAAIRSRCAWVTSAADDLAGGHGGGQLGRGLRDQLAQSVFPHSSTRIRGTLNRCSSTAGAPRQRLLRRQAGSRLVGAEHVGQAGRVRGRRDAVRRDLLHLRDRRDDLVELRGKVVKLFVAEREPGQPGQVSDLVAGNRHGAPS